MSVTLSSASQIELNTAVQRLADVAGDTIKEVLPAQARLFCADLAYNTKPIGKDSAGQKKGHDEVAKRVRSIYLPMGAAVEILKRGDDKVAKGFQRLVRQKNFGGASAYFARHSGQSGVTVGAFDGGELHRSQAFSKRVSNRLIVTDYPKVNQYIITVKKRVGFAKGGFASAARQLGGTRGIPGYASRQPAPGSASVSGDGKMLTVSIANNVKYIRQALDDGGEDRAIKFRAKAVTAVIKRMMDRKTKSASRSLR